MTWAMKKIAAVCAFSAAMSVTAASASPIYIGYSTNAGVTKTLLASSLTGSANFSGSVGASGLFLNLGLTGQPVFSDILSSTSISSRLAKSKGPVSVLLYFSGTDLTDTLTGLVSGWDNNSNSTVGVTESTFLQACANQVLCGTYGSSDVFSTSNLLASKLMAAGAGSSSTSSAFPLPSGIRYDETLQYSFTLTPSDRLNAGIDLTGTPAPVPEPLTLSLFGAGIAGIAAARRRKKAA